MRVLRSRALVFAWLATAVAGVALLGASSPARADDSRDDFSWPVDSDVRVDIEIIQGKIEINGWDKDEVRVRARGGGADSLDIDASDDWVSIRLPGRGGLFGFGMGYGANVDLQIDVPRQADIRAKTINGPIDVEDVRGSVVLQSANGKLEVDGEPEEARLETVSSSIEFEGRDSNVDARTVSGSIKLRGVGRDVSAATMSGSIEVEGHDVERADLKSMSGSVRFRGSFAPGVRAHFKSYSGTVELELPSDTSARFDVQNFSGSFTNEFGAGNRRERKGRDRARRFDAGDGDGRVTVETFSGSVKIESKD